MVSKPSMAALAAGFAALAAVGLAQPAAAAAGGLDPSFGTGGKVLTNLGVGANGEQIQAVATDAALASDGDIIVAGNFGLVRYLPNGKRDTNFGTDGLAQTSFGAAALAIEPDGDYLVAGQAPSGDFALARFTTSGTLDKTFGNGGVATTAFPDAPDGAAPDAVLVEPSGDILVGGEALIPGTTRNQPVVAQGALALYTAGGTLATAFGSGGLVQSAAITSNITTVGIDASGDIFVLPAHAEFSPAGQLDSSVTPETITGSSHGGDSAFLPSGQSATAGTVGQGRGFTEVQVQELNADGSADAAFSNPPFTYTGAQFAGRESPGAIAVQPDGKIVIAGSHFHGTSVFGVARLGATGRLDSGFGSAGVLTTSFRGSDGASAVVIQPNGDIVAVGSSENSNGVSEVALARYLGT